MSKDIQRTALRLPRDLHNAIHEAAAASGRTMNAEIVYRLQRTFDEAAPPTDSAPRQYQRKQKYTIQSDMPDEAMQELMARIQEVWDKYKAAQDK
ncbi:Arc family DNA-binding protein [Aeromonas salmonicida]|uniref:Arc family DNA-binding protein n=1 Tax=Aeromonas salmonicida TaxID=645 RepID=UPI00259EF6F7|nr:Arc family DNA-binding protein [Aeromonas salmonicida]MDM5100311.1 Arc family DNA-binding protein [Aeromonas salmonicida]